MGHTLHPAPALVLAGVDAPRRPSTLGPSDRRAHCRALAAGWWHAALEGYPGGAAAVADQLGVHRSLVWAWGTPARPLQLGDVMAAPPAVARIVLARALDRVDTRTPAWCGSPQALVARITAGIGQIATVLEDHGLRELTDEQLAELEKAAEENRFRSEQMAQAFRAEQARRQQTQK